MKIENVWNDKSIRFGRSRALNVSFSSKKKNEKEEEKKEEEAFKSK